MGSSGFARRYSRNRFFFPFLRLLRCFSSPGSLRMTMDSSCGDGSLFRRVSPFRYLRLYAYLQLPASFRSLSRLSSAPGAKASAPRPFLLNRPLSFRMRFSRSRLAWRYLRFLLPLISLCLSALFLDCLVISRFANSRYKRTASSANISIRDSSIRQDSGLSVFGFQGTIDWFLSVITEQNLFFVL